MKVMIIILNIVVIVVAIILLFSGWLLKLTEHFITFKEMFNKLINHLYFQMMSQGLA